MSDNSEQQESINDYYNQDFLDMVNAERGKYPSCEDLDPAKYVQPPFKPSENLDSGHGQNRSDEATASSLNLDSGHGQNRSDEATASSLNYEKLAAKFLQDESNINKSFISFLYTSQYPSAEQMLKELFFNSQEYKGLADEFLIKNMDNFFATCSRKQVPLKGMTFRCSDDAITLRFPGNLFCTLFNKFFETNDAIIIEKIGNGSKTQSFTAEQIDEALSWLKNELALDNQFEHENDEYFEKKYDQIF